MNQKTNSYGFRVWPQAKTESLKNSPCSVSSFLCPSYEANLHMHSSPLLFDLHKFWNLSLPELLEKSSGTEQGLGARPHPKLCWFYLALPISNTTCVTTRWPTGQALEILPCSLLCYWTALALQKDGTSEKTSGKRLNSFLEEGRNPTIKENEQIKERKQEGKRG